MNNLSRALRFLRRVLCVLLLMVCACAAFPVAATGYYWLIAPLSVLFVLFHVLPCGVSRAHRQRALRLRVCAGGEELLVLFLAAIPPVVLWHILLAFRLLPDEWRLYLISAGVAVAVLAVVFWNGIVRVYLTSHQLGVRWRVIGIVCGWIPVLQLWALWRILRVVHREVEEETAREHRNRQRREQKLCATRYPLLLVHGVCFRDYRYLNYWGRIPAELTANGAAVYYGQHQSASSVEASAEELTRRIRQIVEETGCEKVNIIAHSKGGIDCRYAITHGGAAPYVASLTTVNTPHRGCEFADYLLDKIPEETQRSIADKYNAAMRRLGDDAPDFLTAMRDLTAAACSARNANTPDMPGVLYRSVGSRLDHAVGGRFPLNFSYHLVKYFDGPNDGLVSESSFPWGEYRLLSASGRRGISHGDMIDLNRENIPGFDVREFYVQQVAELKSRGL